MSKSSTENDPYQLGRFVQRAGRLPASARGNQRRQETHPLDVDIFPQIDGLAFSSTSKLYSIKSIEEAKAYLDHPILGPRLLECAEAALRVEGRSAAEIFGSPDDLKLRSVRSNPVCLRVAAGLRVRPPARKIL